MKKKALPPVELVKERLDYNPETGVVVWKVANSKRVKVGSPVGRLLPNGYLAVRIDGEEYKLHRLIWLIMTGEDPDQFIIDHINRVKLDNRWSNLRLTDDAGNSQNKIKKPHSKISTKNTTGAIGVTRTEYGKYRAYITDRGKRKYLGNHETVEQAAQAREVYIEQHF